MTPRTRQKLQSSASRFKAAADFSIAVSVVARHHGLDPQVLRRPIAQVHRVGLAARKLAGHEAIAQIARARHEALYLAATVFGAGPRALADAAAVRHSTLIAAVRQTEERRDDPVYDRHLDELELECLA
jgi:hypothetical protein